MIDAIGIYHWTYAVFFLLLKCNFDDLTIRYIATWQLLKWQWHR